MAEGTLKTTVTVCGGRAIKQFGDGVPRDRVAGEIALAYKMGKLKIGPPVYETTATSIVMAAARSDLAQYINSKKEVTTEMINRLGQLIGDVAGEGFVYVDLKPENILVMGDGTLRLCDFDPDWTYRGTGLDERLAFALMVAMFQSIMRLVHGYDFPGLYDLCEKEFKTRAEEILHQAPKRDRTVEDNFRVILNYYRKHIKARSA